MESLLLPFTSQQAGSSHDCCHSILHGPALVWRHLLFLLCDAPYPDDLERMLGLRPDTWQRPRKVSFVEEPVDEWSEEEEEWSEEAESEEAPMSEVPSLAIERSHDIHLYMDSGRPSYPALQTPSGAPPTVRRAFVSLTSTASHVTSG